MAVVAVADGVQDGFADRAFAERGDIQHEQTVLKVLPVVAEVD